MELDITQTNIAVRRLLSETDNPRHKFMLEAYDRHRNLEMAGRYREIFEPEMTVEHPVYRLDMLDQSVVLDGSEEVQANYREWTELGQNIFYAEDEELAVGDRMIVSRSNLYQQTPGAVLAEAGVPADAGATYLVKMAIAMIWPYDERGRMIGEDVWEYDRSVREFIELAPEEVLTSEESGKLLDPLIKPLPAFI